MSESEPTDVWKWAAAATMLAIAGGVVYGLVALQRHPSGRRVDVGWSAGEGPDAGYRRVWVQGVSGPGIRARFGLDAGAGVVEAYALVGICTAPPAAADGGGGMADLPAGISPNAAFQRADPDCVLPDGGTPWMVAVLEGEPEWPCACVATDAGTCEWLGPLGVLDDGGWRAAPTGRVLWPGTWRGDCYPRTCVEQGIAGGAGVCL